MSTTTSVRALYDPLWRLCKFWWISSKNVELENEINNIKTNYDKLLKEKIEKDNNNNNPNKNTEEKKEEENKTTTENQNNQLLILVNTNQKSAYQTITE